jgi:hypothetical protein
MFLNLTSKLFSDSSPEYSFLSICPSIWSWHVVGVVATQYVVSVLFLYLMLSCLWLSCCFYSHGIANNSDLAFWNKYIFSNFPFVDSFPFLLAFFRNHITGGFDVLKSTFGANYVVFKDIWVAVKVFGQSYKTGMQWGPDLLERQSL